MSDRQYQYEESGYFASLVSSMNELRRANIGCDCHLVVGAFPWSKQRVPAHLAIVASASAYCRYHLDVEKRGQLMTRTISITADVNRNTIDQCVNFMYTGKAEVDSISAEEIAKLSNILQLDGLKKFCLDILCKHLTLESCASVIEVARLCKMKEHELLAIRHWVKTTTCGSSTSYEDERLGEWEKLWKSAAWLLSKSKHFREACPLIDVLEAIQIEHFPTQLLLSCVLTNNSVKKNDCAVKYVSGVICNNAGRDINDITLFNYFAVKEIYRSHKVPVAGLEENLRRFMIDHFESLAKHEGFLKLDKKEILLLLSSPELLCSSEESKFSAMMRWVKHKERRHNIFTQLFSTISLANLPTDVLRKMKSQPLIAKNPELLQLLVDAACDRADETFASLPRSFTRSPSPSSVQQAESTDANSVFLVRAGCDDQQIDETGSDASNQTLTTAKTTESPAYSFPSASVPSQTSTVATTSESGIDEGISLHSTEDYFILSD